MLKPIIVPMLALELLLVSFSASSVAAFPTSQVPSYSSTLWQTDDGLPQEDVQALCQTRDGYICVGVPQGLARFDGMRFTTIGSNSLAVTKNLARTLLCTSSDGTLWSATTDGKLQCWKDGMVTELPLPTALSKTTLTVLFASRDNSLWVGTDFGGLLCFKNGQFNHWTMKEGLGNRSVRSICEGADGVIWVATGAGVTRLQGEKVTTLTMQDGLPHNSIRAVWADRKGNLWVASNFGLTRWKEGAAIHFTTAEGLSDNLISVIFEDRKGSIWVGTLNGLNRFVDGKWRTETRGDGTSYDRVNCIFEDREGNLWIGSRDGLSRLKSTAITTLTQQQGLTHNTATFVFQDQATNLWVGFWGGGVNKIQDSGVESYTKRNGLSSDLVLTMHQGRQGDLWFGMDYDGGMTLLRNGKFISYGNRNGLRDQAIKVFQEDSRTNLWIGTRTALLRFKNGKFQRFTTREGLPADTIEAIHEDRSGRLWFGTTGGLALWMNQKFQVFTTKEGLSHNSVTSIYEDRDGILWMGTRGGGLNRVTLLSQNHSTSAESQFPAVQIAAFTSAHGLFHDQVFAVLEDDVGFLWMGSPQGIFRVSKKELENFVPGKSDRLSCLSFGKAEGMLSVQCKGSDKTAACKSHDGRLWFATAKGVVVVDPKNIAVNELPPPVVIERVSADKRMVEVQGSKFKVQSSSTALENRKQSSTLNLPPGRGELEFHYTALSYTAPEKNRFKYKLEGVDADWVEAETRRVAYYNNIGPGSYRFQVLACNNDGVWNESGATVALVLQPHFWQTLWFQSGVIVGIALVIFGTYRLRVTRLREIERLRLKIAADLHDEVGSTVGSISVLSEMLKDFGEMGEEEKKDVAKINHLSMQTASSIREIVWFINPEYDTLHELLLRMKDVTENLLSGMTYRMETPRENLSRNLPLEFRQNFFLIFKETLANVMKHSKASCVEIQISEKQGEWRLVVRDNGVGFDPNVLSKGNGLKNLRRRADKLKGTLGIKSQVGQGTRVEFVAWLKA